MLIRWLFITGVKYKIYNWQSKHNKIYYAMLQNNYMFWPFFRPSSGCIRLAL